MYTLIVTTPPFVEGGVEEWSFVTWEDAHAAYHAARVAGQAADLYAVVGGRMRLVSPAGEGVRDVPRLPSVPHRIFTL